MLEVALFSVGSVIWNPCCVVAGHLDASVEPFSIGGGSVPSWPAFQWLREANNRGRPCADIGTRPAAYSPPHRSLKIRPKRIVTRRS